MNKIAVLALMVCLCASIVWAQCATGVDTGGGNCIPQDAPGMPGYDENVTQAPQQPAVWEDRWGAIASDSQTGDAGTTEGQQSKFKANQIAMNYCARNGARHCKIMLSFHNQCAAAAFGNNYLSTSGAPSKDEAEQAAISHCKGGTCNIVYIACSMAQRLR